MFSCLFSLISRARTSEVAKTSSTFPSLSKSRKSVAARCLGIASNQTETSEGKYSDFWLKPPSLLHLRFRKDWFMGIRNQSPQRVCSGFSPDSIPFCINVIAGVPETISLSKTKIPSIPSRFSFSNLSPASNLITLSHGRTV